jgi:salicylate hydroxylase
MAFEDAAVIGEVLSRLPNDPSISKRSPEFLAQKRHALAVYETCRKERTQMVVKRGNVQQYLYHLHDGPEQEERDSKMRMVPTPEGECLAWRDPGLAPKLLGYDHIADVSETGANLEKRLTVQVNEHWDAVAGVDGEQVVSRL